MMYLHPMLNYGRRFFLTSQRRWKHLKNLNNHLTKNLHPTPYRIPFAQMLKHVFEFDVMKCPKCGEQLKLVGVVIKKIVAESMLSKLGLPAVNADVSASTGTSRTTKGRSSTSSPAIVIRLFIMMFLFCA